ncbi:MAG TPA: hypothetical protein VHQ89_03625 [Gaiellaceae bacterium]|jgi:energy-converting hydrogenase Eha subunit B|nr:hypothetical protein [Gaiellaceae bacterium]
MSRGAAAFAVTSVSLLCALALVPLAMLAPLYQGETASEGGVVSSTTGTLVGANGYAVLVPLCVPLVLALAGWIGLHLRCARGSRTGTLLGRSAAALLGVFAVLASASIGIFVLPAALLLILGTALTPDGRAVGR